MPKLTDARKNTRHKLTKRKVTEDKTWYNESQKLEAVQCWLMTGNLSQTAAALSIKYDTLKTWRYSDWWKELVAELKQESNMALTARLKKIASNSLDHVEDRLENGDWYFDRKTGQMVRKQLPLHQVHRVAMDTLERVRGIEKERVDASIEEATEQVLRRLADNFAQFATRKNKPTIEVTDVIFGSEAESNETTN